MVRRQHRPTFKDAIVRIYSLSGDFFGTGCLTIRGLVVTCAHVIEAALDLKQVIGVAPKGRVRVDFPFLPEEPALDAEIASGGWGWEHVKDEKQKPGNDVAILRLIGAPSTDDVPGFSPGDVLAGDRKVIAHGFTRAYNTDGGTVEGLLGSDLLRPARTSTRRTAPISPRPASAAHPCSSPTCPLTSAPR